MFKRVRMAGTVIFFESLVTKRREFFVSEIVQKSDNSSFSSAVLTAGKRMETSDLSDRAAWEG